MAAKSEEKDAVLPCCVCPESRKARDECIFQYGPESSRCTQLIEFHIKCLEQFGFISSTQ